MTTFTWNGHTCTYTDSGQGPALLFGHSYLWSASQFEPQIAALSAHYRCLAVDLPGHGSAATPTNTHWTLADLVAMHLAFLRHLAVPEVSLIGSSIGGMWGLLFAHLHPPVIHSLTLLGTTGDPEPETSRQRYDGMLSATEQAGIFPPPIISAISGGFISPARQAAEPQALVAFQHTLSNWPVDQIADAVAIGRAWVHRAALPTSPTPFTYPPTLIIHGGHDPFRSVDEAEALVERTDGTLLRLANSGHLPNVDEPERVTKAITVHLSRVYRSTSATAATG